MNSADLSNSLNSSIEEVPNKLGWQVQNAWREAFARSYKEKYGKWDQEYRWEYFSESGKVYRGVDSIVKYKSNVGSGFYVWVQDEQSGEKVFKSQDALPEISKLQNEFTGKEVVVFDLDFTWCLFFTHEDHTYFEPPGFIERDL